MSISDLNWGSVSDWVSGVATVVAVITALVFSLRTEREQRDNKLAAVYAWFEIIQTSAGTKGKLWVTNNTDYPIYKWEVTVAWPAGDGAETRVSTGDSDYGLLPPGKYDFGLSGADGRTLPDNDANARVELTFRDAQDRTLRRLATGKLIRGNP